MPSEITNLTDAGKQITTFSDLVLSQLTADVTQLSVAAQATGLTALDVAAPIAREMNKEYSGDYSYGGLRPVINVLKETVAVYGLVGLVNGDMLGLTPLTENDYETDLAYSREHNITNTQSAGLTGYMNRIDHPVMNDLGTAKIQLGTAMEAVKYYNANPGQFQGTDPLNLSKYVNDTPQLVQDLINPATSLDESIKLQAVVDKQGYAWAATHVANWSTYSDQDKATFLTAYSANGQQFFQTKYNNTFHNGVQTTPYAPDLAKTDGSSYIKHLTAIGLTNGEVLNNALTSAPQQHANAGSPPSQKPSLPITTQSPNYGQGAGQPTVGAPNGGQTGSPSNGATGGTGNGNSGSGPSGGTGGGGTGPSGNGGNSGGSGTDPGNTTANPGAPGNDRQGGGADPNGTEHTLTIHGPGSTTDPDASEPLVLNLLGGAVHTTDLATNGVTFDVNGTGNPIKTGWILPGEAFLVQDASTTPITSAAQMIADFGQLSAFDTNHDGQLSAAEANAAGLKLWLAQGDASGHNVGALETLSQAGIAAITIQATTTGTYDNGNLLSADSSFTKADGTKGDIADAFLMNGAILNNGMIYATSQGVTLGRRSPARHGPDLSGKGDAGADLGHGRGPARADPVRHAGVGRDQDGRQARDRIPAVTGHAGRSGSREGEVRPHGSGRPNGLGTTRVCAMVAMRACSGVRPMDLSS